jgi:hypothetical protein
MLGTGNWSVVVMVMVSTFAVTGDSCAAGDTGGGLTIPVRLEGTLLGPNERHVQEGFVILNNSPPLCAVTAGDGRFRVEGLAWEMPDTEGTGVDSQNDSRPPILPAATRGSIPVLQEEIGLEKCLRIVDKGGSLSPIWRKGVPPCPMSRTTTRRRSGG